MNNNGDILAQQQIAVHNFVSVTPVGKTGMTSEIAIGFTLFDVFAVNHGSSE